MAAASPRKPRRTTGRHRKASGSGCVRWLQAGAVGFGLAAAIASGQGVASAATDDSSSSSDSSSSADNASSGDQDRDTKATTPRPSADNDDADTSEQDDADDEADDDDEDLVDDASDEESDDAQEPTTADPDDSSEADSDAESSVESAATVDDTETPITETESTEVAAPVALAAPQAATMAAPEPGTSEWYFQGVLQRAISRLAGWPGTTVGAWPGTPRNFVTITNRQTDQSLDAANNQLDNVTATAGLFSAARWLPDLIGIIGTFFVSLPPSSTTTDRFNAMGDFLNRVVPPFNLAPGAGTLDIISPYKIMGAAVVGTATVLQDMLNGIYDPQQWAIHVIKATTGANATVSDLSDFGSLSAKVVAAQAGAVLGIGDGGAFDEPERAWNVTLPTWTEAQTNPFTIVTYIAFVGIYKRFQEMAALQTYSTTTTYDSWHYKNALGLYAAGTFHVLDQDGNPVKFFGVSQGGTFSSATNALVTINNDTGGFTYTPPAVWDPHFHDAAFFHRSTSENEADRYDTVQVPVLSADGAPYTLTFRIEIIGGTNANPTGSNAVTGTDAAGVVKGKVTGADSDGDTLKYSLVGSSVNGLSGNSAYTKNGANNGGIVTVNPTTGEYTYVSTSTAGATQSFQMNINDGHHGNTVITVTVPNTTSINPSNVNTSTQNVVTGSVPGSTNKPGAFVSYTLGTTPTKGAVTSFNTSTGAFTYTRNAALGHTTTPNDFVTVIATDADGRQVTLRMAVAPTVPNAAPVVVSTTTDKGSTDTNKWRLSNAGGDNRTQTTTGKITATDADGDTLTYSLVDPVTHAAVTTTTDGGTVTFNADGSFTYTITENKSYFHTAARIGATTAEVGDTFTVAVGDGFGGVTYTTITMSTYAVNSVPTFTNDNYTTSLFGTSKVVWGLKTTDADGDEIPTSRNATPGYSTSNNNNVTGNLNIGGASLGYGSGTLTITLRDGYYFVDNGVVRVDGSGTKVVASYSQTWT